MRLAFVFNKKLQRKKKIWDFTPKQLKRSTLTLYRMFKFCDPPEMAELKENEIIARAQGHRMSGNRQRPREKRRRSRRAHENAFNFNCLWTFNFSAFVFYAAMWRIASTRLSLRSILPGVEQKVHKWFKTACNYTPRASFIIKHWSCQPSHVGATRENFLLASSRNLFRRRKTLWIFYGS